MTSIAEYANSNEQASYYHEIAIPKRRPQRRGEFRTVYSSRHEWLSQLHRGVAMVVANSVTFTAAVQGFVKRRSIRTNAEKHLGAKVVFHADIKDFFDAITTEHVQAALVTGGVPVSVAHVMARACTIDGLLRQGTRCSPMLANLVCQDLDRSLEQLASARTATYTRYADDLTFSGDDVPELESVRHVVDNAGFRLNERKCFVQRRGKTQYVTGLCVVDASGPRLPRRLKRQLRLVMHYVGKYGANEHFARVQEEYPGEDEVWLEGMLRFARSIEPQLIEPWQQLLRGASERAR
jgi:hypothetical protein